MARSPQTHLLNGIRGGLIGTAEVIPGISGGTVALITGIYDRLIVSSGHLLTTIVFAAEDLPRRKGLARARQEFVRVDLALLIAVLAGMAIAAITAARIVVPLVENHPQPTYAVFFGLVLASLWVPFRESGGNWHPREWLIAALFAVGAFVLTGLPPNEITDPHPLLIMGAAAVAICALVLPGVSGSFFLLAIGLYTVTFDAINGGDLGYIALFAAGAMIGLSLFVKVLQWLLEHHYRMTMVCMTGLLAGSLRALWPWQPWDSDSRALLAPVENVPTTVGLICAGALAVGIVVLIEHRTSKSDDRAEDAARADTQETDAV